LSFCSPTNTRSNAANKTKTNTNTGTNIMGTAGAGSTTAKND
jgi:hypothetical protein